MAVLAVYRVCSLAGLSPGLGMLAPDTWQLGHEGGLQPFQNPISLLCCTGSLRILPGPRPACFVPSSSMQLCMQVAPPDAADLRPPQPASHHQPPQQANGAQPHQASSVPQPPAGSAARNGAANGVSSANGSDSESSEASSSASGSEKGNDSEEEGQCDGVPPAVAAEQVSPAGLLA